MSLLDDARSLVREKRKAVRERERLDRRRERAKAIGEQVSRRERFDGVAGDLRALHGQKVRGGVLFVSVYRRPRRLGYDEVIGEVSVGPVLWAVVLVRDWSESYVREGCSCEDHFEGVQVNLRVSDYGRRFLEESGERRFRDLDDFRKGFPLLLGDLV